MQRRQLFVLSALAVALGGGSSALADRLGGAYRGPEEAQTTKDTSQSGTGETAGPDGHADGGGGSTESGGGVGSDSGSSGSGSGGGSGGGDSGGGSGGGDSGGSSGSGGGDTMGGDGGGATGGGGHDTSGGGGGGATGGAKAGPKGKGGNSAQDALMVVSWYFEHNREKLLSAVAEASNRRVRPNRGSVPAVISVMPIDSRVRSSVTVEDRERIFDVLKKSTLAAEDVVRDAAVIALGKIGTPDAVQILRTRLDEEVKWDVKEDVLLALGIARTTEAIDALEATLKGNKPRLHIYALLGLGLTQNAERSGTIALEFFNQNLPKRKQAEDALSAAAIALGVLRCEKAVGDLVSAGKAKSTPDSVKVHVAQALGRIGGDDARKGLESMLESADSPDVARAAILGLGGFADTGVARVLGGKKGLGSPDPLCAGFAAISLARVLDAVPESEWKKLPDELRDMAVNPQKGAIKSQYANLALSMFDGGIDADVRRKYAEELKNGSKTGPDVLSSMAMACGVAMVPGMESSLSGIAEAASADPKLRGYAALSLGMSSQSASTAKVLHTVYDSGDNPDVQRGAVLALGIVGDRDDVPFLLNVIVKTDKSKPFAAYTRGAAVAALGMIRDGESVAKIQDLLRNNDALVRAYAIAALGYLADKDASPVLPTLFEHSNFRQEFNALKITMRTL